MVLNYIVLEDISSTSLGEKIIKFSKDGYELHGYLFVLHVGGSEIYYQSMILKGVQCLG